MYVAVHTVINIEDSRAERVANEGKKRIENGQLVENAEIFKRKHRRLLALCAFCAILCAFSVTTLH